MRVPLSWLRDFAPIPGSPAEIAATLDDLGLIVEGVEAVGEGLGGVVVARVLAIRPHPDADKVRLVDVDDGSGEALQIVCGAWNFVEGDIVPLATIGSVLPGDFEIARRKVRGQLSNGMLCSARELRLADDAAGILVLGHLEPDESPQAPLVPGTPLTEALGIEPDAVFDIDVLANRPDAMCVAGVARDLAARYKVPFRLPTAAENWASAREAVASLHHDSTATELSNVPVVELTAPDACDRFTAQVLERVNLGPSPSWMQRRLTLAGMRPINNVVDVSNYVMLELGAPNHPYDADDLRSASGATGLRVRMARAGESLTTLDGTTRAVGPADCVITDLDDVIVGVAGVMGGARGEISSADAQRPTTSVLLEMAHFTPMVVARTAKRLGMRTEASARFERGTDAEGIERAVARFVQLAVEHCGALPVGGWVDERIGAPEVRHVEVRPARVNAILGSDLSAAAMEAYVEPLGYRVVARDSGSFTVEVPSWRHDSTAEIDVIEEIGRHHGFAHLPRRVPKSAHAGGLTAYQLGRRAVRRVLAGAGVSEAWTSSLVAPGTLAACGLAPDDTVTLRNPLVADESALRTSLLPGLLQAVGHNVRHRQPDVALFEVGRVFRRPVGPEVLDAPARPIEAERVAVVLAGAFEGEAVDVASAVRMWDRVATALRLADPAILPPTDTVAHSPATADGTVESVVANRFSATREAAEKESGAGASGIWAGGGEQGFVPTFAGLHPGRAGLVVAGDSAVGVVGEVDPALAKDWGISGRIAFMECDLELLLAPQSRRAEGYQPIGRFPSADVDLAFSVDVATPAASIAEVLHAAAEPEVMSVELFDAYRTEAVRSLAFRVRVASSERTLTDDDLVAIRARCISAVESAGLGTLRS